LTKQAVKQGIDLDRPEHRKFKITFDHPDVSSEESEDLDTTKGNI